MGKDRAGPPKCKHLTKGVSRTVAAYAQRHRAKSAEPPTALPMPTTVHGSNETKSTTMKRRTKQPSASTADGESRRKAEEKARKRIAEQWEHTRATACYRLWAATAYSKLKCSRLKAELSDGPLPKAIGRSNGKSAASLKRILRRIVEKRQAQAIHKMLGRSENLLYASLVNKYTSFCMEELHEVWKKTKIHCQV